MSFTILFASHEVTFISIMLYITLTLFYGVNLKCNYYADKYCVPAALSSNYHPYVALEMHIL